jgi:hypothetical protein
LPEAACQVAISPGPPSRAREALYGKHTDAPAAYTPRVANNALPVLPPLASRRRVTWSPEIGQRVADLYAEGKSLRDIASADDMPDYVTLWRWKGEYPDFATALTRARASKAEVLVSEGREVLRGVDPDSKFGSARVAKANSLANYLKWEAGCLDRDTYGDRPTVEVKIGSVAVAFAKLSGDARAAPDDE